jgi:hypothetical protein
MFDASLIVQSAVSSFNNLAISAPSFLWQSVLMLPLFWLVAKCGRNFIKRDTERFSFYTMVIIFAWLILMPGNYMAVRDSFTVLPFVISGILFIGTANIVFGLKKVNMPIPRMIKRPNLVKWGMVALVILIAGFAGMPTWWGFVLGGASVLCGALVGRALKRGFNPISFTTMIMLIVITAMLMQPEFFRFGQLGGLTILHMGAILFIGMLGIIIFAIRNVNPRARIHNSAFIKLKWMARIVSALCLVLFILTESVPVFLGLGLMFFISTAMSVWHAKSIPDNLSKILWGYMLCAFGVITVMPVITALGILYLQNQPRPNIRFLL